MEKEDKNRQKKANFIETIHSLFVFWCCFFLGGGGGGGGGGR